MSTPDVWQQVADYLDGFPHETWASTGEEAATFIRERLTDPANRGVVLRALGAEEIRSTFRDFDGSMKTRRYYVTLKEDVTDAES